MHPKSIPMTALMAALFLSLPVTGAAQSDPVAELDSLLGEIETLSADVLQLIMESDGGVLEESEIRMRLKKPGGFYWETVEPFPELIVTDGVKLWNYQPDLEQVVIEDWDSSRSELAAQLLNGETEQLAEEYTVAAVRADNNAQLSFQLTPRASDSIYHRIAINFIANELDSIHLDNKNGEQTLWQFNNLVRNQALADSLFIFDPPEGIEIVENSYVD